MYKRLFFTSAVVVCLASPVMADNPIEVPYDQFPDATQGQYMQANRIYLNSATKEHMDGVYEGEVDAVAMYADVVYTVMARKYLRGGYTEVSDCPEGSFCPGLVNPITYSESDQGNTLCSTLGDHSYTNSDTGAMNSAQCYKACSENSVANAKTVSGRDYYDTGIDTCSATACNDGWSLETTPTLSTTINGTTGSYLGAVSNSGTPAGNPAAFGLSDSDTNAFAVSYGDKGSIKGAARCSTFEGTSNVTSFYGLTDETGQNGAQYCYCYLNGYTASGGTEQTVVTPWLYAGDLSSNTACADQCAHSCAMFLQYDTPFRSALFGAQVTHATCKANVININWKDAPAGSVDSANATCQYGGNVTAPYAAPEAPKGQRFLGWMFKKKTQN